MFRFQYENEKTLFYNVVGKKMQLLTSLNSVQLTESSLIVMYVIRTNLFVFECFQTLTHQVTVQSSDPLSLNIYHACKVDFSPTSFFQVYRQSEV